ncbi:DUF4396 domain-containing protein [Gordonia sp. SID5947]|uniref:DUF4396 domain-containing protein n=1 Tax=Gordonia sp. SID5947 TaxID=2690315 RepID=UPI00136E76E6|nr:DUF4396 domain-containing protein [Gordonia sp. SID5947]MYR08555.1 DUF4396 domain-containing protein [Gordonia sp. SID5947]
MADLSLPDLPTWLVICSWTSVALGIVCAVVLVVDLVRRPQPMAVMNAVWPICALFGSVLWVGAYLAWGRAPQPRPSDDANRHSDHSSTEMAPLGLAPQPRPYSSSVFVGTSHCGAGCTVADLLVEWLIFAAPSVAVLGGMDWLFSDEIYAGWVIAYVAALIVGIGFQYFAIAPMNRDRGRLRNLRAAGRADVLSLTAWQIGMYGMMAIAQLAVFPAWLGGPVAINTPVFWAVMQLAMLTGFVTSFPVNWWLINAGVKEAM